MTTEQLFFELIQVAIGTRICLSHTPSVDEWGELYAMAKKTIAGWRVLRWRAAVAGSEARATRNAVSHLGGYGSQNSAAE